MPRKPLLNRRRPVLPPDQPIGQAKETWSKNEDTALTAKRCRGCFCTGVSGPETPGRPFGKRGILWWEQALSVHVLGVTGEPGVDDPVWALRREQTDKTVLGWTGIALHLLITAFDTETLYRWSWRVLRIAFHVDYGSSAEVIPLPVICFTSCMKGKSLSLLIQFQNVVEPLVFKRIFQLLNRFPFSVMNGLLRNPGFCRILPLRQSVKVQCI